jgi:hypothetical protein
MRRDVERSANGKKAAGLVAIFTLAENRIGALVRQAASAFRSRREAKRFRGLITVELHRLDADVPDLARELITDAFATGARESEQMLGGELSGINTSAVTILADNLIEDLGNATTTVGRRVDDIFRREALRGALAQIEAEQPEPAAVAQMVARLEREGVTGFVDRAGRRWKLSTYAQMAIRTTQSQALSEGVKDKMLTRGFDLVKVSDHNCHFHPADPENPCRRLEGKVCSLTGRTPGYPSLEEEGLPGWHPNCTHYILPAVEAFARRELVAA